MHRLFAAAAAAFIIGLLYAYDPATTAWFPSCPFRALTGLLCPLCGSLRAAHALLHGHLVEAFLLNPFTLAGGLVWLIAARWAPELKLGPTFAPAAVIFTVLRNLP
jgi:hypothetical protein